MAVIALIDTGTHPGIRAVERLAFGQYPQGIWDETGHGTMMARLIHRWAPDAQLYSLKSYHRDLNESRERLKAALGWVTDNTAADVVMIAQAVLGPDEVLHALVHDLASHGVTIVAAAMGLVMPGGERRDPWGPDRHPETADDAYPGAYPEAFCVTAAETRYRLTDSAATGWAVDLAAPGANLVVADHTNTTRTIGGASTACAYVSAELARLYDRHQPTRDAIGAREMMAKCLLQCRTQDEGVPILWNSMRTMFPIRMPWSALAKQWGE